LLKLLYSYDFFLFLNPYIKSCPLFSGTVSCKTVTGKACVFPFTFRGVQYTDCTTHSLNRRWCGTTAQPNHAEWGYCGACSSGPPPVVTVRPPVVTTPLPAVTTGTTPVVDTGSASSPAHPLPAQGPPLT
jgi:hypothetical protein